VKEKEKQKKRRRVADIGRTEHRTGYESR